MNTRTITLGVAAVAVALLGFAAGPPAPPLLAAHSFATLQGQNRPISALNSNLSSGTPTANSTVVCGLGGVLNSLAVGSQGSYSATLIVQVTADNANWVTVPSSSYTKVSDGSTGPIAGSGMWTVPVAGLSARVTCSAYVSGSAAVSLIPYSAGGGSSGGGSVTQGTSPWVTSAADGGIVTLGSDADSATAGAGTANAHLREIATLLSGTIGTNSAITNTPSVTQTVGTSGGITTTYQNGALTNTVVSVRGSGGNFYGFGFSNPDATHAVCIEVFNTASGSVTLGTTAPIWHMTLNGGQGANRTFSVPITCGTAISIVAVSAYNGSTAPTTAADVELEYN